MTSDVFRLVYHSRNLIPGTATQVTVEVERILETSRHNNSRDGITGALIFNAGIFAQVLEGGRVAIEVTFERIQRDERHGAVEVLAFEKVASRGFPSWSMAFVGHSREGQVMFSHIGEETGFEAKRLEGERIFAIMRAIAIDEEARAA